eukprot:UN12655
MAVKYKFVTVSESFLLAKTKNNIKINNDAIKLILSFLVFFQIIFLIAEGMEVGKGLPVWVDNYADHFHCLGIDYYYDLGHFRLNQFAQYIHEYNI